MHLYRILGICFNCLLRRPSGNAEADSRSYVVVLKQEKLKFLQSKLVELEAQNKMLQAKVEKKETNLLLNKNQMVSMTEDFEQVLVCVGMT